MSSNKVWNKVPVPVRRFLIKAVLLFAVWQVVYLGFLQPKRIPDMQLTNITCQATTYCLSWFYPDVDMLHVIDPRNDQLAIIHRHKKAIIGIGDPCNALEIFVLYWAFLLCFPGNVKRKWVFFAAGTAVIFVVNVWRCVALAWLKMYHRSWVDISHHYIFTIIVYLIVFYMWVLFSKAEKGYAKK